METTERTFKSIGLLAETCRLQEHPVNAGSANYVLGNIQRNIEQRALDLAAALAASAELEKKLQAAEQRASDIETNTAAKLAEFAKMVDIIDAEAKRLGIEWHGSASTMLKAVIEAGGVKPGSIVFEPTGEVRIPESGEWYLFPTWVIPQQSMGWQVDTMPIYRRIDSPAAAAVEPTIRNSLIVEPATIKQSLTVGEGTEPLPPPVSEQEGERAVYFIKRSIPIGGGENLELWKHANRSRDEHIAWFYDECDLLSTKAYLNGTSPEHATIREQATEIERLKGEAARIQSVRDHIDTELFESTAKLPHRCSDDDWRLATCSERVLMAINEWEAISPAIERLKWLRQDMGYDEGTKLESTPGLALSRICCLRQWMADRDDRIAELTKQLSQSPAPAEASEGSKRTVSEAFRAAAEIEAAPAPAAESGKWNQVSQINGMYHINCGLGVPLQEAAAAADWLNARAEVEAQLSKYKRDAEAWEAVRKHGLSVNRGLFGGKRYQARREASAFDDSRLAYSDPADAVLALASQLEPTAQKEGT